MSLLESARARRAVSDNLPYLAAMGSGSVLGLIRGFFVAALLPVADFGLYGVVVAVAAFLSPIIGLGRIEETRKLFPRLAVEGRMGDVHGEVGRLILQLVWRSLAPAMVLAVPAWLLFDASWAVIIGCTAALLLGNASCMVLASALRAGSDLRPLGNSALLRGVVTFIFAGAGAYYFGLTGVLVGEAAGALAATASMRAMLGRLRPEASSGQGPKPLADPNSREGAIQGRMLLLAGLLLAFPLYMSRPLIGLIYTPEQLGTFGFLGLFFIAIATFYGITDQIIGPQLVRMEHSGVPVTRQKRQLALYLGLITATTAGGLAIAFLLMARLPLLEEYNAKYAIDIGLAVPTVIFCILQATSAIDWLLQAHNGEKTVLLAAAVYATTFVLGFAAIAAMNLPLLAALWLLVIAKTGQLAFQAWVIGGLVEGEAGVDRR